MILPLCPSVKPVKLNAPPVLIVKLFDTDKSIALSSIVTVPIWLTVNVLLTSFFVVSAS